MELSRHWRSAGVLLIVALVVSGVVVAATRADGRTGSQSASNDGGAWLVKRDAGAIGHLNREVLEVSAGVRVADDGANIDVEQSSDVIAIHDRSQQRVMLLDGRTNQTRGELIVPPDAEVSAVDGGIVIHERAPLRVWMIGVDELASTTDLGTAIPTIAGSTGLVAVGHETTAVFDADTSSVARYVDGLEIGRTAISGTPSALTLANGSPVVAIGDEIINVVDGATYRPGTGPFTFQQPSTETSIVVVDSTNQAFVLQPGGDVRGFPLPSATIDPINHRGCVFAIVEPSALLRNCGEDDETIMPLEGAFGELRLRLVNGWVWVNDLDTGGAWVTNAEAPLSRIDDWGNALADEEIDESDATVEDGGGIEEVRLNPDAEDVKLIEADQQDDDDENEPPVARDDEASIRVDRPVVVRVLDNDEDADGDVLLVESVELLDSSNAQVSITPSRNTVQVTPAAGFTGTISFAYVVSDGRGGSARALVTTEVTTPAAATNQPPTPVTDIATARAGAPTSLNVLTNDTDPDGDALVLIDVTAESGAVIFDPSGQVTFTPDTASQQGRITLGYVVADDFGAEAEGRIIVNVRLAEANSSPDARNDSVVTSVGNPARTNVLDNDTDPDNDALIVARQPVLATGPDGVDGDALATSVQMTSDGEFFFIPDTPGIYLFDYLASDGQSNDAAQIRVDVTPAGVNLPPVAVRDDVSIPMGGTRLVYVLDNDGDPNGDIIDIVEWSPTPGLNIEAVPGIGFRVTVETDAPKRATFRYAISDGVADPVATVVVVSVADVASTNQPPVVRPDSIELRPGRSTTIPVLLNDFDPEGGSLSVIRLPESDAQVTYELGPEGQSIIVTLAPSVSSGFRFGYDVTDLGGATAASIVDVRVIDPTEPNRPPVARPDIGRTVQGAAAVLGVVVNDSDPDGDVITIESIASQPANGSAEIVDGNVLYTPAANFTGTDRFTYVLIDTEGARSIGSVQVGVTPVAVKNRPPSANDDSFVVNTTADLDILANDHDPDGDALSFTSISNPTRGSIIRSGSIVRFTPPVVTEPLELSFTYEITDGHGNVDAATVRVVVEPEPDPVPPIAVNDQAGPVRGNREVTIDVLTNDRDPDGESSALLLTSLAPEAKVLDNQLVVTVGRVSTQVRYRITDPDGLTDEATVTVLVVDNQAPSIRALRASTPHDAAITLDLDAQASDPDNDQLFFVCCDNVTGGVAEIVQSGADVLDVVFTPSPGFTGTATFSFGADDQAGHLVAGSVQIIVEPPDNRPPDARAGTLDIEAGTTLPFNLGSLVTDPDDDRLTFRLRSTPLNASLSGSTVSLRAPIDAAGSTATLEFDAVDPAGATASASLAVTVTPVAAPPPRAIADSASTNQGQTVTIDLIANDIDPLGNGLTIIAIGASANGSATASGGAITFTPNPNFFGTTTFTYTIHDAANSTDRESVGQVTVDVIGRPGVGGTPTANADNATATVTWPAPAQNGAPIDIYRVEYRSSAGNNSVDLGAGNSHRFSALTNGAEYEFRVQAHNIAGWGDWSPWSNPVRPDTIPDRPATPTVAFGNGELAVTWSPPANTGSAITGYQIEIGGGANQVIAVGTSPYTWRGLTNGTEYQFRVAAVNAAGNSDWSGWSTSEHPLTAPASPAASAVNRGNRYLDLGWSAPVNNGDPVSSYDVQIQSSSQIVSVAGASTTNYRWANLANGQAQQFRVRASNRAPSPGAWSAWSAPVVPCAVPDAAGTPTVVRGDGQVTVSWGTPGNQGCAITSYTVRANGSAVQTTGVTNSHTFTGLTNGTSYVLDVQATNEEGGGGWSPTSAAVTPAGRPTPPTISALTPNAIGQLAATWGGANPNGSPILRHELSINGGAPVVVGASGHTIGGLANSTGYDVRVRACNDVGCSDYSPTVSAITWGPPSAPVGVNASAGNATGQVNWSTPSSAGGTAITSYQVTLSNGTNLGVGPNARSQPFTGLANNTTHTATVAACNAVGCGPVGSATFTPTQPPVTLVLTRGGPYSGANCASGNCQYMHIEGRNLTAGASVGVSCYDNVDDRFKTVNLRADGSGSISANPCHMGYPGRQVWTSVSDPVRGQTFSNTLTW